MAILICKSCVKRDVCRLYDLKETVVKVRGEEENTCDYYLEEKKIKCKECKYFVPFPTSTEDTLCYCEQHDIEWPDVNIGSCPVGERLGGDSNEV